jgi:hypothetical protein
VFLSTLRADREAFTARHPKISADADGARVLRSVLMKPESEHHVEHVHSRVEQLARAVPGETSAGSSPAPLLRAQ